MQKTVQVEKNKTTDRLLSNTVGHVLADQELAQVSGGKWVPNPTNQNACDEKDEIWVY